MPEDPGKRLPALWRNRDYMLLWSGQVISTLGTSMSGIVFPLLILALTASPFAAGVAGALTFVPYVLLSLPAGALIDRWDRKRVMIICDAVRALAFFSIPVAFAFGWLTVWQLYVVALVEGTGYVFFNIAEVAALPRVVPKEQLPDATAQNMATFSIASLVGPGLGGFLYKTVGQTIPFLVDAVSYAVSAVSLSFVRVGFQTSRSNSAPRNLRLEIKEGLRWLLGNSLIRTAALLTGGINGLSSILFLAVILLAQQLQADEAAIGLIFSIGAVGGIIGSALAGRLQRKLSYGQVTIGSIWLLAVIMPLIAFAPNIIIVGVLIAIAETVVPIYSVVQISYRLPLIPDKLQGRVNSVFRLLAFGFQPLGSALGGVLLEFMSPVATVLVVSVGFVALAVVANLNREVRNAPRIPAQNDSLEQAA